MLWALREIPNATTGVSPFTFVYGINPRESLTIVIGVMDSRQPKSSKLNSASGGLPAGRKN